MAGNSDGMDLDVDDVLFDRENDVFDFDYSTMSNVNLGVSLSETLIGDVGGINSSMGVFSGTEEVGFHMSSGCDVMINCGQKEGFYLENFNGLEDGGMLGVVDGGCDGKVGKFSRGLVQNEDERTVIQRSSGGCAVSDKNLVFGLNDGIQIEQECEDAAAAKVAEVSLDMEDLFSTKSFLSDAQVNVIQDYIQYNCCALDLVVDLNSYKNIQEDNDNVPRDSVFSDGNYRVSDLVWGKVRGHPWWPGQIYDPSIASEMAKSYQKENCYLIAYFGEQKFAWNEVSKIKPFHKNFSKMAKQTNCEIFRLAVDCALEEASRQVALGLSCPCLPEEVSSNLKTQVVANAEIRNQSFEPAELVNFVQSLAQSPLIEFDRLDLVSARGQLLAFYRSKGYSQLPEFAVLDRLFVPDMEIPPVREEEQCDDQVLKTGQCFLPDLISEKNSWTPNGECTLEKKAGDNPTSRRGRKRKVSHDPPYDYIQDFQIEYDKSTSRRGRKPKAAYYTSDDYFQNFQIAVNNSTPRKRGRKPKLACKTYDNCFNNSQTGNSTGFQNVSIHDMWSQLCLTAKSPAGESCYTDVIDYFADFKKVTGRNNSVFLEQGFSLEQKYDGETGATKSIEDEAAATASVSTPMDIGVIAPTEAVAVASVMEDEVIISLEEETDFNKKEYVNSVEQNLISEPSNHVKQTLRSEPSNHVEQTLRSEPFNHIEHVSTSEEVTQETTLLNKQNLSASKTCDNCFNNSQTGNSTGFQNVSIHDMWSQLCLTAKGPAGESCYTDVIDYFADFKKVTGRNNSVFLEQGFSLEQKYDGETGATKSIEDEAAATASVSTPMDIGVIAPTEAVAVASVMEDEVIISLEEETDFNKKEYVNSVKQNLISEPSNHVEQNLISEPSNHVEQTLRSEPSNHVEQTLRSEPFNHIEHVSTSEEVTQETTLLNKQNLSASEISFSTSLIHQNTDENLASEPSNQVEHASESSPTAFILKFTNFDSVPSAKDLNQIFARFGPLIESKTELLERTKCIRVVFKRRIDAESAFCSAGQYSIFGPSLKSYRLKILPPMPKKSMGKKRGRKSKKEIASMEAAAV